MTRERNTLLTREDILWALGEIDARAAHEHKQIEIAIYGGGAMLLGFNAERATRDVSAVVGGDVAWVRGVVTEIAKERGWDDG